MPGKAISLLQSRAERLLDFAFPWACSLCGDKALPSGKATNSRSGVCFCDVCSTELTQTPVNSCDRCGARVGPYANTRKGCVHCRKRTLHFDSVICLAMYEGLLRKAILSAKWSYSAVPIESLANLLAQERQTCLDQLGIDLIIPVPQSWQSRLRRPFNPAERIATRLGKAIRRPVDMHVLARVRNTAPQKRVAVNRRFENQESAFRTQDLQIIRNRRLLLVDDVLTTGATCSEAAKRLKANGASNCHVAVIGRVLDHSA